MGVIVESTDTQATVGREPIDKVFAMVLDEVADLCLVVIFSW